MNEKRAVHFFMFLYLAIFKKKLYFIPMRKVFSMEDQNI